MSFPFVAALSDKAVTVEYSSTSTMRPGSMGMTEDGSFFRLCRAGEDLTNTLCGKVTQENFQGGVTGTCIEGAGSVIVVGDEYVDITDATNSRAADYYKDGWVVQPKSTPGDNIRRIVSSDAESSDTYRLHVSAPFTVAQAAGETIMAYTNPFKDIRNGVAGGPLGTAYDALTCYANHNVTSGYYFWGKRRGPHWVWLGAIGTWPGAAAGDRVVSAYPSGTVWMLDENVAGTSYQTVGYLLHANNYGDMFVWLTLE